ncbi:EAL domain protein, partial [Vibrio parahaemolyticus V-223/04]
PSASMCALLFYEEETSRLFIKNSRAETAVY